MLSTAPKVGTFYEWNSEYAKTDLEHTLALVLVTALERASARTGGQPRVWYAVRGTPVCIACCWLDQFCKSCILDDRPPWAASGDMATAITATECAMAAGLESATFLFDDNNAELLRLEMMFAAGEAAEREN